MTKQQQKEMASSQKRAKALTARQEKFVAAYLVRLDAKAAALEAGYSPRTAGSQGCQLLKNPKVDARISAQLAQKAEKSSIQVDEIIQMLADLPKVDALPSSVRSRGSCGCWHVDAPQSLGGGGAQAIAVT